MEKLGAGTSKNQGSKAEKTTSRSPRQRSRQARMSTGPGDTDQAATASSSIRKRHSPNSGSNISRRELESSNAPAASSAVQSALHSKQRRIISGSNHSNKIEETDSSVGRELRYLTDFFPDQVDNGRITRSKARGGITPPSTSDQITPGTVMATLLEESNNTVEGTSNESASKHKIRIRRAMRPSERETASAISEPDSSFNLISLPLPTTMPPLHPPEVALSNLDPRIFPSTSWEVDISIDDPANSSRNNAISGSLMAPQVTMAPHYLHAHPMINQIPVIQPTQSTVPIGLNGMLFDPVSASSTHVRAISRSAASQFIHGLVPRMQHLLGSHRAFPQDSRVTSIMEGLRSANELRQAEAASELAEWLLMANEDNLPSHLPVREITHSLIQLLQKEHNFELMLTAARCLRNLLEAVPRAQPIVVDAVPFLLEKLKRIECVDVAEQALTALEELSKRNSKTILAAGGIAACISHVDFFSLASQRLAFSIASNCAMYLTSTDFHLVRDSLSDLTERLLIEDKRCLESVCQLFARLVENLRNHPDKLREIAGTNYRLLALLQQHLVAQPSQLSSTTFSSIIRMLRTFACKCPDLAAALIRMDYQATIRSLFTGNHESQTIDIIERPPNQFQDLVFLVGELFPRLPTTGMFDIDAIFFKQSIADVLWYYQDEDSQWQPYRPHENKLLEMAKSSGAGQQELAFGNSLFRVDLVKMTQKNLSSGGEERPVQRRSVSPAKGSKNSEMDGRLLLLRSEPDLFERVVASLFPVLVAIDGSSSGPALRFECLRVMLRMICPMSANVLRVVLSDLPLSGHIASALASPRSKDLSIVVAALQMVHILLEKMDDIYAPLFRKEGVAHEVQKLAALQLDHKILEQADAVSTAISQADTIRVTRSNKSKTSVATSTEESKTTRVRNKSTASSTNEEQSSKDSKEPASNSRHRKRTSPDGSPAVKKEKEARRKSSGIFNALRIPGIGGLRQSSASNSPSSSNASPNPANYQATPSATSQSSSAAAQVATPVTSSTTTNSRKNASHSGNMPVTSTAPATSAASNPMGFVIKERLRAWIKKEAERLLKTYLSEIGTSGQVIDCLSWVAEQLEKRNEDVGTSPINQLYSLLEKDPVSAFEMNHSGVISALHNYLVSEDSDILPPRKLRLKRFAAVFMHLTADNLRPAGEGGTFAVFESLISKTLASVGQMEQFQVKVNDMGGIATGTSGCLRGAQALRFFQSHQIKCCLRRHPSCRELRDYHRHGGSTIKVDPFTSISAIERYLIDKGIGRVRACEESSGDDISDDEDPVLAAHSANDDRKIEIMLGDFPLPSHMSILQALRQYAINNGEESSSIGNSLWISTHVLLYRLAENNGTVVTNTTSTSNNSDKKDKKHKISDKLWNDGDVESGEPPLWNYMEKNLPRAIDDPCVTSLLLLRSLYGLNRHWSNLFEEEIVLPTSFSQLLSSSAFHSAKLSAKLQRQLSDFISVATQQLPCWTTDLVKVVPFLFPFSLRRSLLYCTAFGRERALMHLVSQTEGAQGEGEAGRSTPRLERRKITVKRDDILKSAETALANNASARAMLEVSFENEAGSGFGPTLEFYSIVSKEIQNSVHKLWHGATQIEEMEGGEKVEYSVSGHGLYPSACSHSHRRESGRIKKFETLGRLMGQALVDCRMLDLPLSPVFLNWLVEDPIQMGLQEMEILDPNMYNSLRQLTLCKNEDFEHLEQYFTMPGNESFELMKNGRNAAVSNDNVHKFVKLVSWWRLAEGVWREMEAVKRGFSQVIDPSHLNLFMPEELDQLFCGCSDSSEKVWNELIIAQSIKPDHGYTHDSEQIRWLVTMLASFDHSDQRRFVQFVTGSPRLPIGGFRALNPPLTVVRKTATYGSGDDELPSAMTCYNYLKIPAYSSYEIFRERFSVALKFIYSFHLT
ncbi:unnamed protein product [Auanema sp. JU1783]|nr:unnamed protein product [Auanema sp. JU1783]